MCFNMHGEKRQRERGMEMWIQPFFYAIAYTVEYLHDFVL